MVVGGGFVWSLLAVVVVVSCGGRCGGGCLLVYLEGEGGHIVV